MTAKNLGKILEKLFVQFFFCPQNWQIIFESHLHRQTLTNLSFPTISRCAAFSLRATKWIQQSTDLNGKKLHQQEPVWDNPGQPVQCGQITAASLSPLSQFCQLTAAKSPQDYSTQPIGHRDNLLQEAGGRVRWTGEQVSVQSAEQQLRTSHFHTSPAVTAPTSRLFRIQVDGGNSGWGGQWQQWGL